MFPRVRPLTPWEASATLSNTGIAADLPNTAKLDRLTYLESVVANLLLGQPATLGLAALPAVKAVRRFAATQLDVCAEPGDFTGAHFVAFTVDDIPPDVDDGGDYPTGVLATRTAAEMVAELPHVKSGDAWLVLVTNATKRPFALWPGHGVRLGVSGIAGAEIPPGSGQLFLVTVASLTSITFAPLLSGATLPAGVTAP